MELLLEQALRCGMTIDQFWRITPRETILMIEAALWRQRREQKQALTAAWLTAKLVRTKHFPPLAKLLAEPTRALKGKELERRRQEFKEMSANIDLETLNARTR